LSAVSAKSKYLEKAEKKGEYEVPGGVKKGIDLVSSASRTVADGKLAC